MIHMYAVPSCQARETVTYPPRMIYLSVSEVEQSGKYRAIHSHPDTLEISLVCEGQGTHNIGGRIYHSKPGDLLLYHAGVLHQDLANNDQQIRFYCCGITGLQENDLTPGCLVHSPDEYQLASGDYFPLLRSGFESVESNIIYKRPYANELAQGFLQTLLAVIHDLDAQSRKDTTQSQPHQTSLAEELRKYIDYHYAGNFTLEELAQAFHISRFHATHVFTKAFGFSPIQYRTRRRIGEAQSLLMNSDESITYIASIVGYDDPNRFSQVFSKVVGMSPSRYRDLAVRS